MGFFTERLLKKPIILEDGLQTIPRQIMDQLNPGNHVFTNPQTHKKFLLEHPKFRDGGDLCQVGAEQHYYVAE